MSDFVKIDDRDIRKLSKRFKVQNPRTETVKENMMYRI